MGIGLGGTGFPEGMRLISDNQMCLELIFRGVE